MRYMPTPNDAPTLEPGIWLGKPDDIIPPNKSAKIWEMQEITSPLDRYSYKNRDSLQEIIHRNKVILYHKLGHVLADLDTPLQQLLTSYDIYQDVFVQGGPNLHPQYSIVQRLVVYQLDLESPDQLETRPPVISTRRRAERLLAYLILLARDRIPSIKRHELEWARRAIQDELSFVTPNPETFAEYLDEYIDRVSYPAHTRDHL